VNNSEHLVADVLDGFTHRSVQHLRVHVQGRVDICMLGHPGLPVREQLKGDVRHRNLSRAGLGFRCIELAIVNRLANGDETGGCVTFLQRKANSSPRRRPVRIAKPAIVRPSGGSASISVRLGPWPRSSCALRSKESEPSPGQRRETPDVAVADVCNRSPSDAGHDRRNQRIV